MSPCISACQPNLFPYIRRHVSLLNTFLTKSIYLRYLPCITKFSLPPSSSCPVKRNVNDEEYQQVWSAIFCQLPSQEKCQRRRVSTSLVCHLLPVAQSREMSTTKSINKFGLPSSASCPVKRNVNDEEYQQVWSAIFCQLPSQEKWQRRRVSSLVCHRLPVAQSKEMSTTKSINKFSLQPSPSCPVSRNVNNEECLPLVSVSKGCTTLA